MLIVFLQACFNVHQSLYYTIDIRVQIGIGNSRTQEPNSFKKNSYLKLVVASCVPMVMSTKIQAATTVSYFFLLNGTNFCECEFPIPFCTLISMIIPVLFHLYQFLLILFCRKILLVLFPIFLYLTVNRKHSWIV